VLEIISIIIALCAVSLTLWQGWMSRKHNQLSVMPAICSWNHVDERTFHYWIKNKGHGTAKIDEFELCLNGKNISHDDFYCLMQKRFNALGKNTFHLGSFAHGSFFEKSECVDVIKVTFEDDVEDIESFEKLTSDCELRIKYSSLYGKKIPLYQVIIFIRIKKPENYLRAFYLLYLFRNNKYCFTIGGLPLVINSKPCGDYG